MTAPAVRASGRETLLKAKEVALLLNCSIGNIRNNPVWRILMLDFGQRMKRWDRAEVEAMIAHGAQVGGWKSARAKAEAIRASRPSRQ